MTTMPCLVPQLSLHNHAGIHSFHASAYVPSCRHERRAARDVMPPGARPVALGLAARAGDAGGTLSARMGSHLAELQLRRPNPLAGMLPRFQPGGRCRVRWLDILHVQLPTRHRDGVAARGPAAHACPESGALLNGDDIAVHAVHAFTDEVVWKQKWAAMRKNLTLHMLESQVGHTLGAKPRRCQMGHVH